MTWRALVLMVAGAFVLGTTPVDAWARKPPPRTAPPKRKPPAPRKKPRPKTAAGARQLEDELHNERLAIIGRLKEINSDMKDAELAVSIQRLDDLEARRRDLSLRIIERTENAPPTETPP